MEPSPIEGRGEVDVGKGVLTTINPSLPFLSLFLYLLFLN